MDDLIYKEECFQIIGICLKIHRELGRGFLEIVYKDAIQYELKLNKISFERKKEYSIHYKDIVLP